MKVLSYSTKYFIFIVAFHKFLPEKDYSFVEQI